MWLEIWARSPHPRPAFWHAGLSRRDQPAPMRGGRFGRARGDANLSDRIPGPTVRGRFLGGLANVGAGGTYSGDVSRHLRWGRAVPHRHSVAARRPAGWLAGLRAVPCAVIVPVALRCGHWVVVLGSGSWVGCFGAVRQLPQWSAIGLSGCYANSPVPFSASCGSAEGLPVLRIRVPSHPKLVAA